ncbi:MAG: hypothetical protein KDA86_02135 [Planctomycetaceae bacterium]|nr:hypothetical protein [Planctomycetaceae bacterium]
MIDAGQMRLEAVPDWPEVPEEVVFVEAVGVAVDSQDRVFVFARADVPVLVFESDGTFVTGWGEGMFVRPHGITMGPDETVYLVDDMGHSVRHFSLDGEFIRTIGPSGQPSETGVQGFDHRTIHDSAGPPFNLPTNLVIGPEGNFFVSDGYGNARVHRFSADGELLLSWGAPGDLPGQFNVPHGLGTDGQRIFVADRENSRVQIFSPDGELLSIWSDVARPAQVFVAADRMVYVFELGFHTGLFPWQSQDKSRPGGRMSVFDLDGQLVARWGGHGRPTEYDGFYAPHDVVLDSSGNIYTAEVKTAAAKSVGDDTSSLPSLRKFARISG